MEILSPLGTMTLYNAERLFAARKTFSAKPTNYNFAYKRRSTIVLKIQMCEFSFVCLSAFDAETKATQNLGNFEVEKSRASKLGT